MTGSNLFSLGSFIAVYFDCDGAEVNGLTQPFSYSSEDEVNSSIERIREIQVLIGDKDEDCAKEIL